MNTQPNIDTDQNPQSEDDRNHIKTKINLAVNAVLKYSSNRFGVFASLPLMIFNGVTTTIGATKILPAVVGIPMGVMLSIIYFFIVILFRVKQEHPVRRLLLICILCMGSIYTSFFAIYDQLSEGQLKYQPATSTVNAHNKLINDLRTSLNQIINNIEQQNPNIGAFNLIRKRWDESRETRHQTPDKDEKGEIAAEIDELKKRLQELQWVEVSYEYQLHQNLTRLLQQKETQLNSDLSVEEFLNSNQSYSAIFAQDESLFDDIILAIKTTQEFDSNLVPKQSFQRPNYDDYVRTPTFLVPMEVFLNPNSKRQVSYIIFALTVSIFFEIIPLFLGGILTEYPRKILKQRQTVWGQTSVAITKFIENINEAIFEIWTALRKPIELTENRKKEFEKKLSESMLAVDFNSEEKKQFLFDFYQKIETVDKQKELLEHLNLLNHELTKKRIKLPNKDHDILDEKNVSEQKNEVIATALFIDIMQDTTVKWLTKSEEPEYYEFVNLKKYEYFITWLLKELNEDKYSPSDTVNSNVSITAKYKINQNIDHH